MSLKVAIHHLTHYQYDRTVSLSPQIIRLKPAPHTKTPIRSYSLTITPKKHFINWQQDPFGNFIAYLVFQEKTEELKVEVDFIAELESINPFDFFLEKSVERYPFHYEPRLLSDLYPYLKQKEAGSFLSDYTRSLTQKKIGMIDYLVEINTSIFKDIQYILRFEHGVQTCEETLKKKSGSCRDMAWLLCQILRNLGFASRFASGYLIQLIPDIKPVHGNQGPAKDFVDLHAWTEVYLPGAGWIGLDPTSGLFTGENHIPLCCSPEPDSASPVTGFTDVCQSTFSFDMNLFRFKEKPRATKPYSDMDWKAIQKCGRKIDKWIQESDMRLMMGGEPTFIYSPNMDGVEWNVTALSSEKLSVSLDLFQKLKQSFAPHGLFHYGQGKWYPGEPLPRWCLTCLWRKDERAIWNSDSLLAHPQHDYGFSIKEAKTFLDKLTQKLFIPFDYAMKCYEDVYYHLWQEGNLPINQELFKLDLNEGEQRKILLNSLQKGFSKPVGYVLPLIWEETEKEWLSNLWAFRRERLFLLPGDSSIGWRLPLDRLHEVPLYDQRVPHDSSPFEQLRPLNFPEEHLHPHNGTLKNKKQRLKKLAPGIIRSSLCVEARKGVLYIFLPPVSRYEEFLDLIHKIEKTAQELHYPLVLEGYLPPADCRLKTFSITPDPGVIEVNIHPSSSWEESVKKIHTFYQCAREVQCVAEKFKLDGQHIGTNGGNHITLGGFTPAESPFLQRSDLLKSLLTFWQHHPALSYFFSSHFIGPTSQSPRSDEVSPEILHEMEIALEQIPEKNDVPYWLIDRLLRNLLVDRTGNTHRAEICIDKLYPPHSVSQRQGIVELRAFEMPPHPKMNAVQHLFIRCLLAIFWKTPYSGKLIRWGTQLQDKYMLPYFLLEDMKDVIHFLHQKGAPFQLKWLLPFYEFRFPVLGSIQMDSIHLELRTALEPWPVLGEEILSGGTSRLVDAAIERVQIKVNGIEPERYSLLCNGRPVPLQPTGVNGEWIAGVRYKAWPQTFTLHPNIPVQAPLRLDMVDRLNHRSIDGCSYHISHPGGRTYKRLPINANEAEARRLKRFIPHTHTPGKISFKREESLKEFPFTLDLRKKPYYL